MDKGNQIDWSEIYSENFVDAENCWTTCDGYCCKNFYGHYFSVLDKESVVLPMIEEEYEYYQSIGGIKNIGIAQKKTFKFLNGKEFSIYLAKCNVKGLCDPHCARPLICRIYPYFPIVDYEGNVTGYEYASFMDLFYAKEESHKCTLVRENKKDIQGQLERSLAPFLKKPKMIFIFKLMELLASTLKSSINMRIDDLDEIEKKVFFKEYEKLMLRGTLWKTQEFKDKATDIYTKIAERYGDFL